MRGGMPLRALLVLVLGRGVDVPDAVLLELLVEESAVSGVGLLWSGTWLWLRLLDGAGVLSPIQDDWLIRVDADGSGLRCRDEMRKSGMRGTSDR